MRPEEKKRSFLYYIFQFDKKASTMEKAKADQLGKWIRKVIAELCAQRE